MRKIICYQRGCNKPAVWELPGTPTFHVCTECLRKLYSSAEVRRIESLPQYGPDEFKEDIDGQEEGL